MDRIGSPVGLRFDHAAHYAFEPARRPVMAMEFAAVDTIGRLKGHLRTTVLVDSGADVTTLNADLAERLGIDLETLPELEMSGVAGIPVRVFSAEVLAYLCSRWISLPVLFQEDREPNLLGREAAFDSMYLVFAHPQGLMLGIATT